MHIIVIELEFRDLEDILGVLCGGRLLQFLCKFPISCPIVCRMHLELARTCLRILFRGDGLLRYVGIFLWCLCTLISGKIS